MSEKKRMPDVPRRRGSAPPRQPIVAIERKRMVWYRSKRDVLIYGGYGVKGMRRLEELLETGSTAPDGYTTFMEPYEGWPYEGMSQKDVDSYVDDRFKEGYKGDGEWKWSMDAYPREGESHDRHGGH